MLKEKIEMKVKRLVKDEKRGNENRGMKNVSVLSEGITELRENG